jgi:hypothetical protein
MFVLHAYQSKDTDKPVSGVWRPGKMRREAISVGKLARESLLQLQQRPLAGFDGLKPNVSNPKVSAFETVSMFM